jgi:predicted nucleic acid-binding protein
VILDTNALSAVVDDKPAVVRVYSQAASMELPVIVLGEFRFGIGTRDGAASTKSGCENSSRQHASLR